MADWSKIKTEYITTNTSYRKLAEKYGIDQATVARKAKKEIWFALRQQNASKTQAKILDADAKRKVKRAERLQTVADKLLDTLEKRLKDYEDLPMDSQTMKQLSGVLKDIKDIQMIRSDADTREQEARIAKLRKETEENSDQRKEVTVSIEGGEDSWSK